MLEVLKNTTYRHLFLAQVIALIGTGLITIALALQAYDLAKGEASCILIDIVISYHYTQIVEFGVLLKS